MNNLKYIAVIVAIVSLAAASYAAEKTYTTSIQHYLAKFDQNKSWEEKVVMPSEMAMAGFVFTSYEMTPFDKASAENFNLSDHMFTFTYKIKKALVEEADTRIEIVLYAADDVKKDSSKVVVKASSPAKAADPPSRDVLYLNWAQTLNLNSSLRVIAIHVIWYASDNSMIGRLTFNSVSGSYACGDMAVPWSTTGQGVMATWNLNYAQGYSATITIVSGNAGAYTNILYFYADYYDPYNPYNPYNPYPYYGPGQYPVYFNGPGGGYQIPTVPVPPSVPAPTPITPIIPSNNVPPTTPVGPTVPTTTTEHVINPSGPQIGPSNNNTTLPLPHH
ncbi:MAG: hypothetical protein PHW04_01210 [Candidatus Wallbacteria bacterium]|nr:hypothetical protein [Candidatus Wallbacteria bacterium]